MDRLAERELRRRERVPGPLGLLLIDVDHFKSINEQFLLPGGDKVLTDLARTLTSSIRVVDSLGRIGGEEFMVIAPETNREGLWTLAERIRSAVENGEFSYKGDKIPVRVSIGGVVLDEETDPPASSTGVRNPAMKPPSGQAYADYDTLRHWASAALAEAKHTGRNRCVIHRLRDLPFEQAG
jgi:diguanylate cyclase (GGDEF)-like protein